MIWITEATSGNKIAINPTYIVAVFTISDGEQKGKTAINLTNGNVVVDESDYEVIGMFAK
jgi:uncharacterized protein YlzI (FlbEa/FlbD family)